ncbi:MAG: tetratricopeptide repeat protein [Muribaculaceae bacterium]|nr:tetratricopeptide repeat protein [Muribaculaceae bacterium]
MNILRITLIVALPFILAACSRSPRDRRLLQIASTVTDSPREALAALDSIDPATLQENDRHFLDFLTIKAADKAYISHTSDSLILDVVDYYSATPHSDIYPEALYYAGRVYSDLGDSPTALNYFQQALEMESEGKGDPNLRARILSQTGRLLNSLRLYDEAIPCIKNAIEIESEENDSIALIWDLQLLGGICLRADRLTEAEKYLTKSVEMCREVTGADSIVSILYLAGVKYEAGNLKLARTYIRECLEDKSWSSDNTVLAHAVDIYFESELYDSAYKCAKQLISNPDPINKATAYDAILSHPIREYIPVDSLTRYMNDYLFLLESYYNENTNILALNQQSFHNYTLHEREREKAEKTSESLRIWMAGGAGLILLLIIVILYQKIKIKNNIIRLQKALDIINRIENPDNRAEVANPTGEKETADLERKNPSYDQNDETTIKELRDQLRKRLLKIYEAHDERDITSPVILTSPSYKRLQELISKKTELKEDDPLWKELEKIVLEVSPNFIRHLLILVGGKVSSYDIHTAILIKCGVQPTQLTKLLNRTKGTIASRRESMCQRIFDEKLGTKILDSIIRLL